MGFLHFTNCWTDKRGIDAWDRRGAGVPAFIGYHIDAKPHNDTKVLSPMRPTRCDDVFAACGRRNPEKQRRRQDSCLRLHSFDYRFNLWKVVESKESYPGGLSPSWMSSATCAMTAALAPAIAARRA